MDEKNEINSSGSESLIRDERLVRSDTSEQLSTTQKLVSAAILVALGVVLSYLNPFAYFLLFGSKINPFAHVINVITGVLLGPIYALFVATLIAAIRFSVGIGTIHAFPGGMFGGVIVGIVALIFNRYGKSKRIYAAFFEPLGTVFIGATISSYIAGTATIYFWWGLFAASCIPGAIIGYLTLLALKKAHIIDKFGL
ncbi:MAG: energy coupling factor transporter S component ThiW [Promethearchaeota archaeon]